MPVGFLSECYIGAAFLHCMFFTDVLFDVNRSEYTGNGKKN